MEEVRRKGKKCDGSRLYVLSPRTEFQVRDQVMVDGHWSPLIRGIGLPFPQGGAFT